MGMKANQALNVKNYTLLVSLRYLQDVTKGTRPIWEHPLVTVGLVTIALVFILYWFFGTELGASIRATGANEHMARAQGINTNVNKMIGLMLANGLVALSGSLFAQYNGNAEINMGRGAIVIGLAAIIIGDVLFGKLFKNFALKLLAVSLGAIVYYLVIQAVLTLLKVDSQYLKLMSAAIVAVFLTVPNLKGGHHKKHKKEVPTCSK
jgi:putative ABC transport system permease protein